MPNACFFGIPVLDTRSSAEASAVLSGLADRPRTSQCAEDNAHYSGSALKRINSIGLVGFEPTASWSRTRRSTKLSHSPK